MQPIKQPHNMPLDAKYRVIASDEERNAWIFITTHRVPFAASNTCLMRTMGVDVYDESIGMVGVSFYRTAHDEEGSLHVVGLTTPYSRPSTAQILSSAKRLMPMIPKSAWRTSGNEIWLTDPKDILLFLLAYGNEY